MLQSHGSGWLTPGALSALQKFKVKRLELSFVMLTNWFVGNVLGIKKLQLQLQLKNI
jgi:hypothetical protein